jgi:hypothetical protein
VILILPIQTIHNDGGGGGGVGNGVGYNSLNSHISDTAQGLILKLVEE